MAAGLNPTNADALATAICAALGHSDSATLGAWKTVAETIYAHLKTDIQITIVASSITTVGSATTQSGPTSPVNISPN